MKSFKSIILLSLSFIVAACVGSPIDKTDRDTSGTYRGTWDGVIAGTEEVQRSSQYTYYCRPIRGDIELEIDDGVVIGEIKAKRPVRFQTYINSDGYFQARIPTGKSLTGTDIGINPFMLVIVIEGTLVNDEGLGTFTSASPKDGYNGCQTLIRFSKADN